MRFELETEQADLAAMAQRFFADALEVDRAALLAGASDTYSKVWTRMATEAGFPAIAVPEECDGAGGTWLDLAIVLEAAGQAVSSTPLLSTAGAGIAILRAAGKGAHQTLADIAAGSVTVSWVDARDPGRAFAARLADGHWSLTGRHAHVLDGERVDLLLVTAQTVDGIGLFAVNPASASLVAETALDPTRPLATVSLDGAGSTALAVDMTEDSIARACAVTQILVAAELVGVAQGALDIAVEHALARHQFSRPIGGFQAVKHLLADAHAEVDSARAVARYAAWTVSMATDEVGASADVRASELAALTMARVIPAAERVTATALQVLGGIGYTWEHPAHLYYKRAVSSARVLGTLEEYLDRISRQ